MLCLCGQCHTYTQLLREVIEVFKQYITKCGTFTLCHLQQFFLALYLAVFESFSFKIIVLNLPLKIWS